MSSRWQFFLIIFFYIIRHFLTKKLKIFRPHFYPAIFDPGLQNSTTFAHECCWMLSKFIEKYWRIIILQYFSLNFAPRKLKNLQNITNFAHEIYYILSNFTKLCFDKIRKRSLVNLCWRLSNCGEALLLHNSTKKLKKKYPHRGGYFFLYFV